MTQKEKKSARRMRQIIRNRRVASVLLFAIAYVAVLTLSMTSIAPER